MATLFLVLGILRKANVSSSALANNSASFVNVTARRLHIRKMKLTGRGSSTAAVLGDYQVCSMDEVPVTQQAINDSRSHIQSATAAVIGGTGAIAAQIGKDSLTFNRNDLVLDPDEAIFMNITDDNGGLDMQWNCNIWYED